MIFDQLLYIDRYKCLDDIYTALDFLKRKDFGQVPTGKYVLNDTVYYMVQEYYTHMESLT